MKRFLILPLFYCLTLLCAQKSMAQDTIRLVSYNVGAFGKSELSSYTTIARMMRETGANAICLNELDRSTVRSEGVNQIAAFTALMGSEWGYKFGSAMDFWGGHYGSGISVGDAIVRSQYTRLPKCDGSEPRVLVVVETPQYIIATTHLDHTSLTARLAQINTINEYIDNNYGTTEKPIFLGGDMNDTPESQTIEELNKKWRVISDTKCGTYPADGATKVIDYFFEYRSRKECKVIDKKTLTEFQSGDVTMTSDHLPILVEIVL